MREFAIFHDFGEPRWAAALAVISALGVSTGLQAQDARDMAVTGSVDATVDGVERQWLTIAGEVDGEFMNSAAWLPDVLPDNPMAAMMEGMPEAQRERMQAQMDAMAEQMGADSPYAQMFGDDAGDRIRLRIMAVDPQSERILRQGMLSIELAAFSVEDIDTIIGTAQEAEISLFKNFGEQRGLHVSSHGIGTDATIQLDRLEIEPGGGVAEGHFEASLCPLSVVMGRDGDPDDCSLVTGRFATELGEEAPGEL